MIIFLRYSCIGVFNTAIHWLVFWLFYSLVAYFQTLANIVAFLVAVIFSFLISGKI